MAQNQHPEVLIYVVEDNEWFNKLLVHNLSMNPDWNVKSFKSGKALLERLSDRPTIVTLDYRLPDMNGEALLKKIKNLDDRIEVIIISEQEEIETAVDLLKAGAADYLVKSKDIKERLFNTISRILKTTELQDQVEHLQKEVQSKYDFQKTIIGQSEKMKGIFNLISKALTTNIVVSISGETGTGKEVVAKAIHYNSPRRDKPFVAVNMAAIPKDLIESELFGHEKGAFTGATARRKGKFEEAHGGTLFLDEIGEMDMSLQAKLLRVLQEKEITRVGSNTPIKTDCRIIIATNRKLDAEVKAGNFRKDLFYRLFGLPIDLPPLRERGNDILLLAKSFIDNFCAENELEPRKLTDSARQKLLSYTWPGNIRELKSVVELAVVMSSEKEIAASDITLSTEDALADILSENLTMREYEHRIIEVYMKKFDNNTKKVSEALAIGQTTVYRLLKEMEA